MKKIMFIDKYGLTEAVLSGRKTQTRRIIPKSTLEKVDKFMVDYCNATFDVLTEMEALQQYFFIENIGKLPFKVGEVVVVAQSYKDVGYNPDKPLQDAEGVGFYREAKLARGWNNKMFVQSALMPHHIRITDVRVERLNDISESDCRAEGIDYVNGYSESYFFGFGVKTDKGWIKLGNTPREAYAALIDRISGKGTWESNPYVFVYEFELAK